MRVGALGFDAGHEFTHGGAGVVFGQSLAGCEVEPVRRRLAPIPERHRGELAHAIARVIGRSRVTVLSDRQLLIDLLGQLEPRRLKYSESSHRRANHVEVFSLRHSHGAASFIFAGGSRHDLGEVLEQLAHVAIGRRPHVLRDRPRVRPPLQPELHEQTSRGLVSHDKVEVRVIIVAPLVVSVFQFPQRHELDSVRSLHRERDRRDVSQVSTKLLGELIVGDVRSGESHEPAAIPARECGGVAVDRSLSWVCWLSSTRIQLHKSRSGCS